LQAKLWENSSVWSVAETLQLRVTSTFAFLSAVLFFVYGWYDPMPLCHPAMTICEHAALMLLFGLSLHEHIEMYAVSDRIREFFMAGQLTWQTPGAQHAA